MRSQTSPSFWKAYKTLDSRSQRQARKAFGLWRDNHFHPSLQFKCINVEKAIWSARVSEGYRALGIVREDAITWFWVGKYDEYRRYFGGAD